ncbi:MAG: DUF1573 domain-containing protein [Sedimentisphaerales bacterium]|nr:DUF1573 domain-containing protein [Sedimentisphaerales bacterium]
MKRNFFMGVVIGLSVFAIVVSGCGESKKNPQPDARLETPEPKPIPQAQQAPPTPKPQPEPVIPRKENESPNNPALTKESPKIEVENPEIDLGKIGPGTKHTVRFRFKNAGKAALVIKEIKSTCGCMVPELTKKEYQPGESGVVPVTYTSGTYPGATNKSLYVISNDPQNPSFKLTIKAVIELKVGVDPMDMALTVGQEDAGVVPIRVYSNDGTAFTIKSITATNNALTLEFDPAKEGTEFVLKPKVNMQALENTLFGTVQILTSHPEAKVLSVRWQATPCITLSRPRIILQNAEPGQSVTRDVWVTNHCEDSLEIESSDSEKGLMEVIAQEKQDNNLKLEVRITLPPQENQVRRYISDTLTLHFKSGRTVKIVCTGWYKI